VNISYPRFIVDTNILIDLYWGDIIEKLFLLPYEFFSPDVIIDELFQPEGKDLLSLGLKSYELNADGVREVSHLAEQYRNIAINDLFALTIAKITGFPLLTGDSDLRKLAGTYKISVHGILWVLDEMVCREILKPVEAICALCKMLRHGSRLPHQECEKRFRHWEKMK